LEQSTFVPIIKNFNFLCWNIRGLATPRYKKQYIIKFKKIVLKYYNYITFEETIEKFVKKVYYICIKNKGEKSWKKLNLTLANFKLSFNLFATKFVP
jgi:hypothetical protein